MSSEELKPCPFCGCHMRMWSNRDWHRITGEHDEQCVFLEEETILVPATDDQRAVAIADWNRRQHRAGGGEVKQTQQHILRAMVLNYSRPGPDHVWDRLDSEACAKAADEIAALEAECERLRGTMMEVVAKNFAKNLGRAAKDKELDYYLSEGIRELQAERDALAAELAAARGQDEHNKEQADGHDN